MFRSVAFLLYLHPRAALQFEKGEVCGCFLILLLVSNVGVLHIDQCSPSALQTGKKKLSHSLGFSLRFVVPRFFSLFCFCFTSVLGLPFASMHSPLVCIDLFLLFFPGAVCSPSTGEWSKRLPGCKCISKYKNYTNAVYRGGGMRVPLVCMCVCVYVHGSHDSGGYTFFVRDWIERRHRSSRA